MGHALKNASAVIEALGGYAEVAKLTDRKVSAVYMWTGSFPSNTYLVLTEALKAKGLAAPATLWGMTAAQDQQAAAS